MHKVGTRETQNWSNRHGDADKIPVFCFSPDIKRFIRIDNVNPGKYDLVHIIAQADYKTEKQMSLCGRVLYTVRSAMREQKAVFHYSGNQLCGLCREAVPTLILHRAMWYLLTHDIVEEEDGTMATEWIFNQ